MPIIFTLSSVKDVFTTSDDMVPIGKQVINLLFRNNIFTHVVRQISLLRLLEETPKIQLVLEGVCCADRDSHIYLLRIATSVIDQLNISGLLNITTSSFSTEQGDKIFNLREFRKQQTMNCQLFEGYSIPFDSVPDEYLCAISDQLMDDPIYFDCAPHVKYDYQQITNWLYAQPAMTHPMTRLPISFKDIRHDEQLKDEINTYRNIKIKEHHFNKKVVQVITPDRQQTVSTDNTSNVVPSHEVAPLLNSAHKNVMICLQNILNDFPQDDFKSLINTLEAGKYTQALRRISTCKNHTLATKITNLLLMFKESLKIDINEQAGAENRSALHYAAIEGNLELYNLLLQHGCDINLKDRHQITPESYMQPFIKTASNNNDSGIKHVRSNNVLTINSPVTVQGDEHKRIVERLKRLLNFNLPSFNMLFNYLDNKKYLDAIRFAATLDDDKTALNIIKLMITLGKNIQFNLNEQDECKYRPLVIAARNGNQELYNYLIKVGADPKMLDDKGMSAEDYMKEHMKNSVKLN